MRARWISPPIVTLETAAAAPILTTAEAKAALRVSHTDDDTLIDSLVAAASAYLDGWEGALRRALVNQSWRIAVETCDRNGRLWAPLSPVSAATAVQYYAPGADTLTTATLSDFRLIKAPDWAYLEPKPGFSWPSVDDRPDALQAVFTCGYGAEASAIPATIRHAAKLLVGHFYENREESTSLRLARLPFGFDALIHPHRLEFAA